jgi:hypothetical protein
MGRQEMRFEEPEYYNMALSPKFKFRVVSSKILSVSLMSVNLTGSQFRKFVILRPSYECVIQWDRKSGSSRSRYDCISFEDL